MAQNYFLSHVYEWKFRKLILIRESWILYDIRPGNEMQTFVLRAAQRSKQPPCVAPDYTH